MLFSYLFKFSVLHSMLNSVIFKHSFRTLLFNLLSLPDILCPVVLKRSLLHNFSSFWTSYEVTSIILLIHSFSPSSNSPNALTFGTTVLSISLIKSTEFCFPAAIFANTLIFGFQMLIIIGLLIHFMVYL